MPKQIWMTHAALPLRPTGPGWQNEKLGLHLASSQ
jgi:hypothetical protein